MQLTAAIRMTPYFPSKSPQNRFKPLRGILHHPEGRNALRRPLKRDLIFPLSPLDLKLE